MCGICGAIGIDDGRDGEALVRRMMAAMQHRGPDDDGFVLAPPVALGMRRLRIIDLAGGSQPVFNEDRSLAVVFNGEIYNFQEIRRLLESQGHIFRTRSDTESIVHAYEEWGVDCVDRLRGMFAFAVVEMTKDSPGRTRHLFLARDRLGIKPLYYAFVRGALLFASEVKALLASEYFSPTLSLCSVYSYLLFGSVAEPVTIVDQVYSLPPGHRILIDVESPLSEPRPEAYWDLATVSPRNGGSGAISAGEAARSVRDLLEESIRMHLVADVPLGVFLSSGIDSTAVAALARHQKSDLVTLTVVFPEQEFSEAALARRTAQRLGTKHQEVLLTGQELLARLDEALTSLDQPSIDGFNTYFVSWAARQVGLTVALSGLGGDEVFGGYRTFRWIPRLNRVAALAGQFPVRFRAVTSAALAKSLGRGNRTDRILKLAALWENPKSLPHPYFFARALFPPGQAFSFLDASQHANCRAPWWNRLVEVAGKAEKLGAFGSVSYLEIRSYLASTLLRDTDAMSMAHSLEVRVPLLDHPVVEFVARLPESVKRQGKTSKPLIVRAVADLLPSDLVFQPKRTFTFPWEHWLRGPLEERVVAGLFDLPSALRPILNPAAVRNLWQAFLDGGTSWSRPWSLYVLNEWVRRHVPGP